MESACVAALETGAARVGGRGGEVVFEPLHINGKTIYSPVPLKCSDCLYLPYCMWLGKRDEMHCNNHITKEQYLKRYSREEKK